MQRRRAIRYGNGMLGSNTVCDGSFELGNTGTLNELSSQKNSSNCAEVGFVDRRPREPNHGAEPAG